jgi:UPF0716 family protein affecting phage T7 exclusion
MWSDLRGQLTVRKVLRLVLILILLGIGIVLAFGNNVGSSKTLPAVAHTASLGR